MNNLVSFEPSRGMPPRASYALAPTRANMSAKARKMLEKQRIELEIYADRRMIEEQVRERQQIADLEAYKDRQMFDQQMVEQKARLIYSMAEKYTHLHLQTGCPFHLYRDGTCEVENGKNPRSLSLVVANILASFTKALGLLAATGTGQKLLRRSET